MGFDSIDFWEAFVVVAAPRGLRLKEVWGGFHINELWPDGTHKGYSLVCKRHTDASGLTCARSFSMTDTHDSEEVLRRLKRWAVWGFMFEENDRKSHMAAKYAPRKLDLRPPKEAFERAASSGRFTEAELRQAV